MPVELRYETIVVEDGKLHIFKDVYNQNTNTEENLRKVLAAQGVNFEDFVWRREREGALGLECYVDAPEEGCGLHKDVGQENRDEEHKECQ